MNKYAVRTLIDRLFTNKSSLQILKLNNTNLSLKQEVVAKSTNLQRLNILELKHNSIGIESLQAMLTAYFYANWQ